jgi:hypothetical protein
MCLGANDYSIELMPVVVPLDSTLPPGCSCKETGVSYTVSPFVYVKRRKVHVPHRAGRVIGAGLVVVR